MKLPHLLESPRLHPSVFLQQGAVVVGDVVMGADSSVWFNSVVRGDVNLIRIGERTNIQDLCIIHVLRKKHPTHIGDDVSIGHRAVIHGCTLLDRVLIGMGAVVMDGAEVGEDCIVGAGSVVTEGFRVPPGSLVLGTPARVKRPLTDDERRLIRNTAYNYVQYVQAYRDAGHGGTSSPPSSNAS